jgi:hypothetical protein
MIDNNLFRETPTNFELNGPTLSFTTQPVGVATINGGSATFTGIATATFPENAVNAGSIVYQWYDQNGPISNGTNVTGAATTILTISNFVSPTDHNRQIYLQADYVPSGVTGNALNEPANSNVAVVTVYPSLIITTQPTETTSVQNVSATFSIVASATDTTQGNLSYKWFSDGAELTDVSPVSGSSTPNLTIASSALGSKLIKCVVSHPTAGNSPLSSNEVYFNVIYPRPGITIEKYDTTTSTASVSFHDLQVSGDLNLIAQNQTSPTSLISLYASEKDTDVEMEIYGGSGASVGSYSGGKGGYSKIRLTMKKNEEYTIAGLDAVTNCPFVYRKGSLIAVVGKGGDAANSGNGGDGGGINISGASGGGRGGGAGAQAISGVLPSNGIFGSSSNSNPISPDTKATGQNGGRTISCPRGNYWISKGYSACADVGQTQIYLSNGTLVANSSIITRGFKSGYDIRQTAGAGIAQYSYTERVDRTCTNTNTKSAVITHYAVPGGTGQLISITASGDSFDVRPFNNGCSDIGCRYYEIYSPISITSYSITDVSNISAGGGGTGVYLYNSFKAGDNLIIAIFAANGGATFARSFRVTVNQESSYDCSYNQTITIAGGGNGGSGATGGNGGSTSGSGGGGGSGYTDGSVTVLSTQQGVNTGDAKIIIKNVPIKPVLSVTSNILTSYSATAGDSKTFSISVSDAANSSGTSFSYQWYLSTDGGSSYNPISGQTGSSLDRYSTFYYSDNNHKFFCRTTAVNVIGTSTIDSNICTLTIAPSYDCNSSSQSGYRIWNGGLKSSPETADVLWDSYELSFDDICDVNGVRYNQSARGRDGFCASNGGVSIELELRIVSTLTGQKVHWGSRQLSKNNADYMNFDFNISAGGWDFVRYGRPRFELWCLYNGTSCNNNGSNHNIFPETTVGAIDFTYKRASFSYQTRP